MKTGICSITFRQLDIPQLADLVRRAGLDAIEWGGDIHVKPGDIVAAQEAKQRTSDAGLAVSSYGSYYNVLDKDGNEQTFAPVLESALALGTDTIRIWPGAQPSEAASPEYRRRFVNKLRADLDSAAAQGVRLALEFHVNSLNDSNAAALALLDEVNHPNLYTYWQPMYWVSDPDYRFQGLEKLRNRIINLHAFHWNFYPMRGGWGENIERLSLEEGAAEWKRILSVPLPAGEHYVLMEFVRNDSPEQFMKDAAVLKNWVSKR
jgi:sugar phosphate isomerase/epimerase